MTDAQPIITANSRPDFVTAQSHGYTFWWQDTGEGILVVVKEGSTTVGSATFIRDIAFTADGSQRCHEAHCDSVEVDEAHGRRRIANSLYILAELILQVPLYDYWDGDQKYQSVAGAALWAQPNRPFGQ